MSTTTKRPASAANADGAAHHEPMETVMDEDQPTPATPATPYALRLTANFAHLSWGELRAFVRLADLTGVPDPAPVEFETDAGYEPVALAVRIDSRILNGGR